MKTIKVFFSGVVVYLSVASVHACNASDTLPPWATTGSTMGNGGAGAAPTSSASGGDHGGKGGAGGGVMNPVPGALAESGSRLKAKWIAGDDGAKFFTGMHDSMRKEDCAFLPMTDGKRRCAPLSSSMRLDNSPLAIPEYIDPNCTIRVATSPSYACKVIPLYAHIVADSSCPTYDFVTIAPMSTPSTVYKNTGNTCVAGPPTAKDDYYLVGAHVDPSEFVAGSIVTDP